MLIAGNQHDDIHEYSLAAPFDASTASHVRSFDVSPKARDLTGVAFASDGSRMYAVDWLHDNIHEYALSSAYPITLSGNAPPVLVAIGPQRVDELESLAFTANATDINGDTLAYSLAGSPPQGASINSTSGVFSWTPTEAQDGTRTVTVRVADGNGGGDSEVVLVTVNEVNQAPVLDEIGPQSVSELAALTFTAAASDGDIINGAADTLEYSLAGSPPSGASINPASGAFSWTPAANQAGTHVITVRVADAAGAADSGNVTVTVSDNPAPKFASSGLDLGTGMLNITFSEAIDATPQASVISSGMHVRESGNHTHGVTLTAGELVTAADSATVSFTLTEQHLAEVKAMTAPQLTIEPGAVRDASGNPITGSFDVSTASFVDSFDVEANTSEISGVAFSNDGRKMFVSSYDPSDVFEYSLSAAFDVSTARHVDSFDVSAQSNFASDVAFSNDGRKMFVSGLAGMGVSEYSMPTAFDVSTASFVDSFGVGAQDTIPQGVAFSNDGRKMFVAGIQRDAVYEYALSAAFDVSTASFANVTFPVSAQDTAPTGVAFSNDGAKMFVAGEDGDDVNEYALSTPFDVSSASFTHSFGVGAQDTDPTGVAFSNDGAKMFVAGGTGNDVNEYSLVSVYPITLSGNAPPMLGAIGPRDVDELESLTFTANATDADGDTPSFSLAGSPPQGASINSTSGVFSWRPTEAQDGTHAVTVRVADGNGGSDSEDIPITVREVNRAPVLDDIGPKSVSELATLTFTAAASDGDVINGAADTLEFSLAGSPPTGASMDSDTGLFSWTPAANQAGTHVITVRVADAAGAADSGNVTVTVADTVTDTPDAASFVTTWRTTSANETITIPVSGSNIIIDWGDGSPDDTGVTGSTNHTYSDAGNHTVAVSGGLQRFHLNSGADRTNLVSLDQWGNSSWTTMEGAFDGASNMAYNAADAPDLSGVSDMSEMFRNAASFNGNVSAWNVSSVTNMASMFISATSFNQPLAAWDVSSVTDMHWMFFGASSFDQPLAAWDVSSVTNMGSMFNEAVFFDQPLAAWDVSSVTNMAGMFTRASSFDQPLAAWDVSSVTDMFFMFSGASSFDQNLGNWYVTLNSTTIDAADVPGVVGRISAQNAYLDGHNPLYVRGTGVDPARFAISGDDLLNMTSVVADQTAYTGQRHRIRRVTLRNRQPPRAERDCKRRGPQPAADSHRDNGECHDRRGRLGEPHGNRLGPRRRHILVFVERQRHLGRSR